MIENATGAEKDVESFIAASVYATEPSAGPQPPAAT